MSKRAATREYGLFFGSGNYVAGVQRDQFPTLAEANEAARLLAERAKLRHGGSIRTIARNPLRAIVFDGKNQPIRIWVESIEPGEGLIHYQRSGKGGQR